MKFIPILTLLPVFAAAVEPGAFFNQHCTKCHGAEKQKGDLRLDALPTDAETWLEIADRLDLAEMPPEDEPQPAAADVAAIIDLANKRAAEAAKPHQVVLRRLNRRQYRNTLRDLLLIDTLVEDPTEAFPADDEEEGFDNLGEALQMSDFLLRQYLKVAKKAVERATFEGEMPEAQTYTHRDQRGRPLNYKAGNARHPDRDYLTLFQNDERAPGDPRGQSVINCREGATHDGWYEFTFVVESKGRGNLAEKFSEQRRNDYPVYRPEDLHRFEFYLTAPNSKSQIQTRPRILMGAWDLPDNERITIKQRVWMPKEWRAEVGFGNGYWGVVDPILLVDPDFDLEAFRELPRREQNESYGKLVIDRLETADAPRIVVHEIVETGPHYDEWPPKSHHFANDVDLRGFAERAFRRPVSEEEIAPFRKLDHRTAIEAMLCSPRFLYLDEPEGELDDYALASRLSYFLWNTMPDVQLKADAEKNRLRNPDTLAKHLDRMLKDEQATEFIDSFLWAWLKLDNTVEMAPDPMKFYDYHRHRVDEAMLAETQKFFEYILAENLPVSTFLDSDFTFANAELSRHYGLPEKVSTTVKFQRASLASTPNRGGLLGQTSVLTASANGVDTSPVVRGIWILENLMGTPPSPPPPGVDVPEPDSRGDLTIREMYAKHRTVESCNDCHKKIDPLGFALENFDAIGSWRTEYENGHVVDPSGRMPNGEPFDDLAGLKKILTSDLDLFTRNLTTKLLTYATGRTMEASDRAEIDEIFAELKKRGGGMRDLMELVVRSEIFRHK